MRARCSVTFEYDSRDSDYWKGTVNGGTPATILRRAVQRAQRELSPRNWASVVAVIIEREDNGNNTTASETS